MTSINHVRFLCKSTFLVVMFAILPVSGEEGVRNSIAISASERLLPLGNTLNTRDLGGYRTGDGRMVKWGHLYRSDSLAKLGGSDQQYLAELGLSVITDFRSDRERLEAPDRLPEQSSSLSYKVVPVNNPAVDVAALGQKVFSGDLSETELLQLLNRTSYVNNPQLREAWGGWLRSLVEPGALPQMFHCTAGKDRTGFAAAIVLLTLGVSRDDVMEDFLLSNYYLAEKIDRAIMRIQSNSEKKVDAEVLAQVIGVSSRSLEDAFLEMEAQYGSIDKYLSDGLEIDVATRLKLQRLLLQ